MKKITKPFITAWAYDLKVWHNDAPVRSTVGRIIKVPVIMSGRVPELPGVIRVSKKYYVLESSNPVTYFEQVFKTAKEENDGKVVQPWGFNITRKQARRKRNGK